MKYSSIQAFSKIVIHKEITLTLPSAVFVTLLHHTGQYFPKEQFSQENNAMIWFSSVTVFHSLFWQDNKYQVLGCITCFLISAVWFSADYNLLFKCALMFVSSAFSILRKLSGSFSYFPLLHISCLVDDSNFKQNKLVGFHLVVC